MATLKDFALSYAKGGLAVFPLKPKDKLPATSRGFYDASTDPDQINRWWTENPNYNLGIATGKVSKNIFVIDLDYHPERGIDGMEFLRSWESEHGKLPETWSATTGTGGSHLFFRGNGTERTSLDKNHKTGVDVRANGGYVVAPPSYHPNGHRYEWDLAPNEIALASVNDLVYQFLKLVQENDEKKEKLHLPETIEEGSRNWTLFQAACSMNSTGFPDEAIEAAVRELNRVSCRPPVTDRELEKIIDSALHYEKGGGVRDRWTQSKELMRQEILQELKMQLSSSKK